MMMGQGQQPLIAGHQNMMMTTMMAQPQQQQQPLRHPPLAAATQQQQPQYVPPGMHPNQAALLASLGMIGAPGPAAGIGAISAAPSSREPFAATKPSAAAAAAAAAGAPVLGATGTEASVNFDDL
jgi:hypothetical protein